MIAGLTDVDELRERKNATGGALASPALGYSFPDSVLKLRMATGVPAEEQL